MLITVLVLVIFRTVADLVFIGHAVYQRIQQKRYANEVLKDSMKPCRLCMAPTQYRCMMCHEVVCQHCTEGHLSQSESCIMEVSDTPKG